MPVNFAVDILPLFRDSPDIETMQGYGLDLSSYEEVKARASEIYACLADGSMPCDEPWPAERLALLKQWMEWLSSECPGLQALVRGELLQLYKRMRGVAKTSGVTLGKANHR